MGVVYSQADRDRVVKTYARRRRMHPDESDWESMRQAGSMVGACADRVRIWVLRAGVRKKRVYFTPEEKRAAAECLANLSRTMTDRRSKELAREVGYAFGVSGKTVARWVYEFGLYRRPNDNARHPWRRKLHGDSGHKTDCR